jgi:hypothetical protein
MRDTYILLGQEGFQHVPSIREEILAAQLTGEFEPWAVSLGHRQGDDGDVMLVIDLLSDLVEFRRHDQ